MKYTNTKTNNFRRFFIQSILQQAMCTHIRGYTEEIKNKCIRETIKLLFHYFKFNSFTKALRIFTTVLNQF